MPLSRKTLPDGSTALVRTRFRPEDYSPSPEALQAIAALSGRKRYYGDPGVADALSDYVLTEEVEHDGAKWERLSHKLDEFGIEIEIRPDLTIGKVQALPPEWAYDAAAWRDIDRGERVVREEDLPPAAKP